MPRAPKTFDVWKRQAADYAGSIMARGDMFRDHDPYDIADEAQEAFDNEEKPKQFVRRIFAEDIETMIQSVDESEEFFGERESL